MSSFIQQKTIGQAGPYVYRVTYTGENDGNTHKWEYLGLAGHVDPRRVDDDLDADPLTDDEIDVLREEDQLSQFRDGVEADLARRDVANEVRDQLLEEIGEDVLATTDDRRLSVVELAEDACRDAEIIVENTAEDMQAATRTIGQAKLTDDERDRLDFTKRSVFHARASKAVIQDAGVDDWTAIYDPQVEDPAAHRDLVEQNRESISGDRMDNDDGQVTTISQEQAASEQEKQAIRYAQDGDQDAREYLTGRGWTDEEIQEYPA